ncbi:hypothetical protein PC123_g27962, partial [Phytophthora cactorum]
MLGNIRFGPYLAAIASSYHRYYRRIEVPQDVHVRERVADRPHGVAAGTTARMSQVFQTDETSTPRTNVYGILRASPLADGKEAIVLVTQYCNVGADSGENSGLSLGLALLKYLSRAKWLAKDVILLAADDGYLDGSDGYAPGTEAWLQAYHLDPIE